MSSVSSGRGAGVVCAVLACAALAGCGAGYDMGEEGAAIELGTTEEALAACPGDDPLYDYNALAASLAVAIGKELGRWDVNADFMLQNGKLELSTTGKLRCGTGCSNVTALLRLQDDVTSGIPNHSPSIYRQKLSSWYQKQTQKLTAMVNEMLHVEKGIYKLKARHSGKFMAVDGSSTADGAVIEQQSSVSYAGADQWRLVLRGTKHQFVNVRSGKCLTLASDSHVDGVGLVQKTCVSGSSVQAFEFAQTSGDIFAIRTKWGGALDVQSGSTSNDARIQQFAWVGAKTNQQWTLEPVGTGVHISPKNVATAVYSLTFKHSKLAVAVDAGSLTDGAVLEQASYVSTDDRFHWYVSGLDNGYYQLINRRSGKCAALATDTDTSGLVQKTCANVSTQLFSFCPTGAGHQVVFASRSRPIEVPGSSMSSDARIVQAATTNWNDNQLLVLTPILAGEPHRLTFSHVTTGASCGGQYFWYDITQPNREPLHSPADTFVQLIFAGGKDTLNGADTNPFISQQVSGDQIAIDPTYGLNEGGTTSSGACSATCVRVSAVSVAGLCCSCNGRNGRFVRSTWNASTYLCQ